MTQNMPLFTIVTTLLSIALVLGLTALLWRMNDPGKRRGGDSANTGDSGGGESAPAILVDPGHRHGDRHPDGDQNGADHASDGGGSDGGGGD